MKKLKNYTISPMCTGLTSKEESKELATMRGMSEPFFFAFNTLPDHRLVSHGICFTSLVLHPEAKIELLTNERDPRVQQLIKFIKANFIDKQ